MSIAWINVFGDMKVWALDGETGMRSKEIDDWGMCSQVTLKYKAPCQNAWLVERQNAFTRTALQLAEAQVIKEPLCASFVTALGLVTFVHNALVPINDHTPFQALLGGQPILIPPLDGG